MLSGGAMATDTLLPDNPAARIMPVQGGGAMPKSDANLSGNRKPAGWHSTPVIIPVSANSVEELNSAPLTLKNYKERWRRTLGPSVPSRHRPRQDPYIVTGSLDITTCPTYVVAPLRGDIDAAKDTLFWTNDLLKGNPKAHVVFTSPLTEGGSRADGDLILKMLESLMSSYPGHVLCVADNTSKNTSVSQLPGSLDGLVLYAMPHTSKQIIFGFIPDQDEVYSSSVRNLDCLEVETVRMPADASTKRKEGERMLTIQFSKAKTSYNRTKQPRSQIVRDNKKWNAPPGWVSQIFYQTKDGSMASEFVQEGGDLTRPPPPKVMPGWKPASSDKERRERSPSPPPRKPDPRGAPPPSSGLVTDIVLSGHVYKVGKPESAFEGWKQGKFTADEQRLLEQSNLKFSNEVYAIFLKGLHNSKCKTLAGAETDPECGAFRYLMSLAHFNKLDQAEGGAPLTAIVHHDENDENKNNDTPVVTRSHSVSASAGTVTPVKPTTSPKPTTAPIPPEPTTSPKPTTSPEPTTSPTPPEPPTLPTTTSAPDTNNVLNMTFSFTDNSEEKYGVPKEYTQVLIGREPKEAYEEYEPSITIITGKPYFIKLPTNDSYKNLSRLQFGLIKKDKVWYIINFGKTNKTLDKDNHEVKSWNELKETEINTFSGVKKLEGNADNEFSIGIAGTKVKLKININKAVNNALNAANTVIPSTTPATTATVAPTPEPVAAVTAPKPGPTGPKPKTRGKPPPSTGPADKKTKNTTKKVRLPPPKRGVNPPIGLPINPPSTTKKKVGFKPL